MSAEQTPEEVYGNLLMEQYREGKISYAEMVARMANVNATGTTPNSSNSEYWRVKKEKEELLARPWKQPMKMDVEVLASLRGGDTLEDEEVAKSLQKAFVRATEAKTLTATEAMFLSLLLYSTSTQMAAATLATLCLRVSEGDRLRFYNHYVLDTHSETGQALLGRKVLYLTAPLLPEGVNDGHNQHMATEAERRAKGLKGGGDDGLTDQELFYKPESTRVYGGGPLAVYDATGTQTHMVDTASLEAEVLSLREMVRKLTAQLSRLQPRPTTSQQRADTHARGAPQRTQQSQQRNAAQQRNRRGNRQQNWNRTSQGPQPYGTAFGGGVEELELEDYSTAPNFTQQPPPRRLTGQAQQRSKNDSPRSSY